MTIHRGYALAATCLLGIEIAIALFVRDRFIRPHLGDVLVVVLIYLTLRAVTPLKVLPAVALTVLFAFAVETAQAFHLVERLGLGGNVFARTVIGSAFDVRDFIAYTVGGLLVLMVEAVRKKRLV